MRVLVVLGLVACGSGTGSSGPTGPCNAVVTSYDPDPGRHVEVGTPITWSSNPPSSGTHFPVWLAWARVYDAPQQRGYYVHNEEHGGVVFLYNCPEGCPDRAAALADFAGGLAQDPICEPPITARWIVTPDPLLAPAVTVAAAAWGWTYTATCVDTATLADFYANHYGRGPEATCAQGAGGSSATRR